MTAYIEMWGARGIKTPVIAMLYTLNNLLLSLPRSCWETRPDSAMPGQAVSPQAVDTTPTDQIKKDPAETTRHWQPFNTAEQADTHSCAHTHTQICTPPLLPSSHSATSPRSRLLSNTLHTSAGRTVATYHLNALLPGQTIQLSWAELSCPPSSLLLTALALCHCNWLRGLQYLSSPVWLTGQAAIQ